MESLLQLVDQERLNHGYTINHLKAYRNYCNKKKREYRQTNRNLYFLYSLESNFTKFKILNSLAFLYKNRRILKHLGSDFPEAYSMYMECLIRNRKGQVGVDELVQLRHALANYYSFLVDIYIMNDNRHDFEQYKVKYVWNDVEIQFETQKILDSFRERKFFLNDFRFNTQLALKILKIENKEKDLFNLLRSTEDPYQVFELANSLSVAANDLQRYLDDNFVESAYTESFKVSSEKVLSFIKKLLEYSNGTLHADIDAFVTPIHFQEVASHLENMKQKRTVSTSKLRLLLLNILEKRLSVSTQLRRMPFLPVFYDIANDYINYSRISNSISGLLQSFNIFRK